MVRCSPGRGPGDVAEDIRPARLDDLEAMRRICVLTGDSGQDATGKWSADGLLPDVYLEPYLQYPDGLAWVVEAPAGVTGYLVAVADTASFVDWWRRVWVEEFVARHGAVAPSLDEEWLFAGGIKPERMLNTAVLKPFPAHLHVDLLPSAQGQGLGRALLQTLGRELQQRDVPGVHLGVGESNHGAAAFYRRLGFDEPTPGVMASSTARLVGGSVAS